MNLFEDLVADLQKENLLDDKLSFSNDLTGTSQSKSEPVSKLFLVENFSEYEELPANFFQKLENISQNNQAGSLALSEVTEPVSRANNNPQPTKIRKVQSKNKRKGRYCKTCLVRVPFHRFRCKFCNEIVSGNLYYYSFILLSVIAVLGVFMLALIGLMIYQQRL